MTRKLLSAFFVLVVAGCSRESDDEAKQIEAQGYLDVAEVYMEQGQYRSSVLEIQNSLALYPLNPEAARTITQLYLEIGDPFTAQTYVDMAERLEPGQPADALLRGEVLLAEGDTTAALGVLEAAGFTDLAQENKRLILLANGYWLAGDIDKALATIEQCLTGTPDSVEALILKSKLGVIQGNQGIAEESLQKAIAAQPNNLDLWIWRGQYSLINEDYAGSEQAFFEALAIMGDYDVMTAKKFSVLQGVMIPLQRQQKNAEALRYAQIIAETPQGKFNEEYTKALAALQNGDVEQAINALTSLSARAPSNVNTGITLGMVQFQQGNFLAAENALAQFVDANSPSSLVATLAITQLRLNQPNRAYSILSEAAVKSPNDASLQALLGVALQGRGQFEEARSAYGRALELKPDMVFLSYLMAGLSLQQGDTDRAIQELQAAIKGMPENFEAKSLLIDTYMQAKRFGDAERVVEQWQAQSETAFNHIALGVIAVQRNNLTNGRNEFKKALALEPQNVNALMNLAKLDVLEENFDAAEEGFNNVLSVDSANIPAYNGLLLVGDKRGDPSRSIERIKTVISLNPTQDIAFVILSQYFLAHNAIDEALSYAEQGFAVEVNQYTANALTDASFQKAIGLSRGENLAEAFALAEKALELSPENADVMAFLAGLYTRQGNFDKAEELVNRVREVQPDSPNSYEIAGDYYQSRGEKQEALTLYQQAWSLQSSMALGNKIFEGYWQLQLVTEAESFINQWIAKTPEDPVANLNMAMFYEATGRKPEAVASYEKLLTIEPNSMVGLNNLSALLLDSDMKRALELAARAAQNYPDMPQVLDTYGWALYRSGDKQAAASQLERASSLDPQNQEIQAHLAEVKQN